MQRSECFYGITYRFTNAKEVVVAAFLKLTYTHRHFTRTLLTAVISDFVIENINFINIANKKIKERRDNTVLSSYKNTVFDNAKICHVKT